MSLPGTDRASLLEQAWELRNRRDFAALCGLLASEPAGAAEDPEIGFLRAEAMFYVGRWDESLSLVNRLMPTVARAAPGRLLRKTINLEATLFLAKGDPAGAEERFERVLDLSIAAGDDLVVADASHNLGIVADIRSKWQDAIGSYTRALAGYQRLGNVYGVAFSMHNLGITYRQLGLPSQADMHFERALSRFTLLGNETFIASCESERALVLSMLGDVRLARVLARRGHRRCVELGHVAGEGNSLLVLGIVAAAGGHLLEAGEHLRNALAKAKQPGDRLTEAQVLEELAVLEMLEGNPERSRGRAEEAGRIYRGMGADRRAGRMEERLREVAAGFGAAPRLA